MNLFRRLIETAKVRSFGFFKIPLIWMIRPIVLEVGINRTEIKVPLQRITKNHLGSMYFGALAIGADLAGGLLFMNLTRSKKLKTSFVFKDMQASFLKRADGDVHFTSTCGNEVSQLIEKLTASPDRHECKVEILATVPSKFGDEPVAKFTLTLSAKRK